MNVPAASVEVVVPTFNNLHELKACLASLRAQTRRWLKAYVCVDGSNDGTVEYLEALAQSGDPIEVLAHAGNENRGIAATRNLPLERLDAEYVWYVDSDMVLAPDALEAHLALVESMACASQGQVTYGNASQEPWAGYLETRAHHRSPDRAVLPFRWLSGANLLIRTAQVLELGGFDPRFRGYGGEEFDFAYRLEKLSAGPLINNRRAVATTIERKSIARALTQFEEYGATNLHLLESLHPDMPRTFELQRLDSRVIGDQLFVLSLNPIVERVADVLIARGPTRIRNLALNYMVISAVWRGYRSEVEEGRNTPDCQ